ncbi:MAG TPA: nitrate reductase associated protein [Candidatus Binataceae bacterium]
MRQFQFEAEIYRSFECVPMVARRKLDGVGVKLSLEQWKSLTRGERVEICEMPANSPDEAAALRDFVNQVVLIRHGTAPKVLAEEKRAVAHPLSSPPSDLVARAARIGFRLTQSEWDLIDDDERYALVKLGGGSEESHNLRAALTELITKPPSR